METCHRPRGDMPLFVHCCPPATEQGISHLLELQIQAKEEVDTPEFLMEPAEVQQMVADQQPHFVPVTPGGSILPAADPATGIVQRRLSNGLALNARVSDVEPQAALLRLSCVGGRVSEPSTSGPDGQGQHPPSSAEPCLLVPGALKWNGRSFRQQ